MNLFGDALTSDQGVTLSAAIDRSLWIALEPRDDRNVVIHQIDTMETATIDLRDLDHPASGWPDHISRLATRLQEAGFKLEGWQGILTSQLPISDTDSQSAQLQLAAARVFSIASGFAWDAREIAQMVVELQSEDASKVGPLVCAEGRQDHALLVGAGKTPDFVRFPTQWSIAMLLPEPAEAISFNSRNSQGNSSPPDVSQYRQEESARAIAASRAIRQTKVDEIRQLMAQASQGFAQAFTVHSPRLEAFVQAAGQLTHCHGARLADTSFGVAAIALFDSDAEQDFLNELHAADDQLSPSLICRVTNGAEIVDRLFRP